MGVHYETKDKKVSIPLEILTDERLQQSDVMVYMAIKSLEDPENICDATIEEIRKRTRLKSKKSVHTSIHRLRITKWITNKPSKKRKKDGYATYNTPYTQQYTYQEKEKNAYTPKKDAINTHKNLTKNKKSVINTHDNSATKRKSVINTQNEEKNNVIITQKSRKTTNAQEIPSPLNNNSSSKTLNNNSPSKTLNSNILFKEDSSDKESLSKKNSSSKKTYNSNNTVSYLFHQKKVREKKMHVYIKELFYNHEQAALETEQLFTGKQQKNIKWLSQYVIAIKDKKYKNQSVSEEEIFNRIFRAWLEIRAEQKFHANRAFTPAILYNSIPDITTYVKNKKQHSLGAMAQRIIENNV